MIKIAGNSGHPMKRVGSSQYGFTGIYDVMKVAGTHKSMDSISQFLLQLMTITLCQAAGNDDFSVMVAVRVHQLKNGIH